MQVSLTINGQSVRADIEPRTLLVTFIREHLRLTGTHVGCDTTQCGACTVLFNGDAVKSCTMLVAQADGGEVLTVEGVGASDKLHPVQEAFHIHHGLQCGFCTPGMVMRTLDLLAKNPKPSEEEIRHQMEGNLCRCTGYHNIVAAVQAASGQTPVGH